jgi:hypothetical protein
MANDSTFDPDAFMAQTIDAQPGDTEFRLCPEGEYKAMIGDFTSDAFERFDFTYQKGPRAGEQGSMTKFSCPFIIQDDERVLKEMGRPTTTVDNQIILDFDSNGGLDFGPNKNVRLNQVRAAVNQNNAGPWSVKDLRGAGPVMVKVVHKTGKRKDGTDFKRAEVDRVVRLS